MTGAWKTLELDDSAAFRVDDDFYVGWRCGGSTQDPPPPSFFHAVDPPTLMQAPYSIPVPSENSPDFGKIGWQTVLNLEAATFVVIEAWGTLGFELNQDYCTGHEPPYSPLVEQPVGPGGLNGEFKVQVQVAGGPVTLLAVDSTGTRVRYAGRVGPGLVQVMRTGGGTSCGIMTSEGQQELRGNLLITGDQQVMVEAKRAFEVHASPSVIESGDSVTFTITSEFTVVPGAWAYASGDTLQAPSGWGDYVPCGTALTCTVPITASGRMKVKASVDGTGWFYASSNVVWISDVPFCPSYAPGVAGSPAATEGDPCDPPPTDSSSYSVDLVCDSVAVTRANSISCTAQGTAADTSIYEWRFDPGTMQFFDTDPPEVWGDTVNGPSGRGQRAWGGSMVYPGCIVVTAYPDPAGTGTGAPVSDQECITIVDRTGPEWETPETVTQRPTGTNPWGARPDSGVTVGVNFTEGGIYNEDGGVRFFGGSQTGTVPDNGPNRGYGYIASAAQEIRREWQLNQHVDSLGPVIGNGLNFWSATKQVQGGDHPSVFAAGIQAHETYGAGSGDGHQEMLRNARDGDECGNVRLRLERWAGSPVPSEPLTAKLDEIVTKAQRYLNDAVDANKPHGWVGNNFTAVIAIFDTARAKWDPEIVHDSIQTPKLKTAPVFCVVKY